MMISSSGLRLLKMTDRWIFEIQITAPRNAATSRYDTNHFARNSTTM